jgi:hypothetical protein
MAKKQETLADAIARMNSTDKERDKHWLKKAEQEKFEHLHPSACVSPGCNGKVPPNRQKRSLCHRLCNPCRYKTEKWGGPNGKAVDEQLLTHCTDYARPIFARKQMGKRYLPAVAKGLEEAASIASVTMGCSQLSEAFWNEGIRVAEIACRFLGLMIYRSRWRRDATPGELQVMAYKFFAWENYWRSRVLGLGARQRIGAILMDACVSLVPMAQRAYRRFLKTACSNNRRDEGRRIRPGAYQNSTVARWSKKFAKYGSPVMHSYRDFLEAGVPPEHIKPGLRIAQ